MKSYVYSIDGLTIVHRVQARDIEHAKIKLNAIYGINPENHQVMSHEEFRVNRDAALEPMGLAPWQKRLNQQERKNKYDLLYSEAVDKTF